MIPKETDIVVLEVNIELVGGVKELAEALEIPFVVRRFELVLELHDAVDELGKLLEKLET